MIVRQDINNEHRKKDSHAIALCKAPQSIQKRNGPILHHGNPQLEQQNYQQQCFV